MIDAGPTLVQSVALAITGYVSGFLNVVGGGGSLLTLPLMLWMGMPAPVANATNRIALITQNVAATTAFHRGRRLPWRTTFWLLLPTVPAAAFGAWLALDIDETLFRQILVFVMLASLWMVWRQDPRRGSADSPHARHSKSLWLSFLAMGVYAGFLQAGLGFMIIAALTTLGGLDFVRTNAVKVAVVLVGQIVALAIFTAAGTVDWIAGSILAAGSTVGAWHAAHVQIAKGSPWVRRAVMALMIAFTLKLAYEGFVAGANAAAR